MHVAFCQLSVTFSCYSTLLSASFRHLCDCILSFFHAPVWVASAVFLNAALQAYLSNTDSSRTELFHWSRNRATWTLTSPGQNVFLASSIRHLLTSKCRVIQYFKELLATLTLSLLLKNQSWRCVGPLLRDSEQLHMAGWAPALWGSTQRRLRWIIGWVAEMTPMLRSDVLNLQLDNYPATFTAEDCSG